MFACLGSERLSTLIRPYLPMRQRNKRILKEDIPLCHAGAQLRCLPLLFASPAPARSFPSCADGRAALKQASASFGVCVPELPWVGAAVEVLVIPKLHRHQTPTKGCLHDLTLDKCLGWLFIQLYQFSNRSLSLFLSPSIPPCPLSPSRSVSLHPG